ncbi:zinc finger lsd1 subclass family protein, putative, partial [Ichthyophthirius multifiliis]
CNQACLKCFGNLSTQCTLCRDGFYLNNTSCLNCHSRCLKCTGASFNQCQLCSTGFYLKYGFQCTNDCGLKYFANGNNGQCQQCESSLNCAECENGQACTKCDTGYFLQNPDCRQCHKNCLQCFGSDKSQCTQCNTQLQKYQEGTSCLDVCSLGNYRNNINGYLYCDQCQIPCSKCITKDICTECVIGYYYNPLENDPRNYCVKCENQIKYCSVCTFTNNKLQCLKCYKKYLSVDLLTCDDDCIKGYYRDDFQQQCLKCKPQCIQCFSGEDFSCSECATEWCQECNNGNNNCIACESDKNCKICVDYYYLDMIVNPENPDGAKIGLQCPITCETCQNDNICLKCLQKNFLFNDIKNQKVICINSCPDTYFENISNQQCLKCPNGCSKCYYDQLTQQFNCISQCHQNCISCSLGPTILQENCTQCTLQYVLNEFKCIEQCPLEQKYKSDQQICLSCHPSCKTCFGQKSNQCQQCNDGFYFDSVSSCNSCDQNCLTCIGPGYYNCVECIKNYFKLGQSTCIKECPDGYFPSEDSSNVKECIKCDIKCATCISLKQCTLCNNGFYQQMSNINNIVECINCDQKCKTCSGPSFRNCIQCASLYFLYENSCLDKCPSNLREINNKCIQCIDQNCSICDEKNTNKCKTCISPFVLDIDFKCKTECSDGYFKFANFNPADIPKRSSLFICSKCNINCSLCFGPSSKQCLGCKKGLFFHSDINGCFPSCLFGYIQDPYLIGQCLICKTNCISCVSSLFQFENGCFKECPFSTEVIPNTSICQRKILPSIRVLTDLNDLQIYSGEIVIQTQIVSQINILKMVWNLVKPDNYSSLFFEGVSRNSPVLIIPIQNIIINTEYELNFIVENQKGEENLNVLFNTKNIIQVGKFEISSLNNPVVSGQSDINIDLSGWQSNSEDITFDIFIYIQEEQEILQNGIKKTLMKQKDINYVAFQQKKTKFTFKSFPNENDEEITINVRAYSGFFLKQQQQYSL